MKVGCPKELLVDEKRVAMTPDSARQLIKLGYECIVETGAGRDAGFADALYEEAGVTVAGTAASLWKQADIVVQVRGVIKKEEKHLRTDQTVISLFWPGQNADLLDCFKAAGAHAIAMDMVPRISRAQKMDALSSMANIAGYRAVIEAGNQFGRFFTGQITAAGKVPPAKVLVIGAGVAGLAAIGTATSLGAIVRAFDVRPEVAEQIESMGADFLMLEFEEDGSGEGGYAKPASPEFIEKEMALFREQAPEIDIVITTALIPGRPAPKLWPAEMVALMKPGSVVVDLAAEQGGNCDLTVPNKVVTSDNGVTIVGYTDFPSRMASQSSTLYGTNIRHMLDDLTPEKDGQATINMEDAACRCLCTCQLHAAFHRLCPVLLCRLSGHMECQPRLAHTVDGGNQRHLRHHHSGGAPPDRLIKRHCHGPCQHFGADRNDQHCWRVHGNAPHARHVPEKLSRESDIQ